MISIVTCSRNPQLAQALKENVAKTIGCPFEVIVVDNQDNHYGICSAYNEGGRLATGDILVFVHEDVTFLEENWGKVLEQKFTNSATGVVGVAGTQYLYADTPFWIASGSQFCRGRVVHELDNATKLVLTVFSWNQEDCEVVVLDGLFLSVRQTVFEKVRFDDTALKGFHFYDLDFCLRAREFAKVMVTWDILLKHTSAGNVSAVFETEYGHFIEKWRSKLPVQCAPGTPKIRDGSDIGNYRLTHSTQGAHAPRSCSSPVVSSVVDSHEMVSSFMDRISELVEKGRLQEALAIYSTERQSLPQDPMLTRFDNLFQRLMSRQN